ncbi:MAG: tetratricopeptide repeat protein [Flavobacteriaceae bacterium]
MKNSKKITLDESISIKKIIKQYPYFQIARIIELIGLKKHNSLRFNKVLRDCAIYSTDRSVLYDIIEHEEIDLNSKSYDTINVLSSEKTKNSFIEWLKITKPVLKKTKNNNETLISNFLKINHKISPNTSKSNDNLANDFKLSKKEYMTETLAKIYFEQKKFNEAIKAYEILCLKYPEKISLFADQIKIIKNSLKK